MVEELHHVAIVVPKIDAARPTWVDALGLVSGELEHVPGQKVNVLVLMAGSQRIELIEPASSDSPVVRFLERTGGGLHHLAWRVRDLASALKHLSECGMQLIHNEPQAGAHGTRIAFIHPKSTGGVLCELVEEPASSTGATS